MRDESSHVIDITIMDRTYKVKCTTDEEKQLKASASYLDQQMRKLSQTSAGANPDRVAVVTALNICHELLQLKQQQHQQTQSVQNIHRRIQQLRERVKGSLVTEEEIAV